MWLATLAVCAVGAAPGKLALVKRDAAGTTQLAELNGLADAAHDLSADEAHDNDALATVSSEIEKLETKKSELLADSSKKRKEIVLLRTEVSHMSTGLSKTDMDEVVSREGAAASLSAEAESQAEVEAAAKARAQAEAEAQAEAAAKAQAEAAEQAAAEARVQAEAAEARRAAAAASAKEAAAEAAAQRAKAAAAASKAKAAQYTARAQASAEQSHAVASSRKSSSTEDLDDDDPYKEYLHDEDGEDEQGDADYNDSANALASAIGWNRNEVETKANNAVKALTDAIGGKKVVQQVQGMMAGMSAIGR